MTPAATRPVDEIGRFAAKLDLRLDDAARDAFYAEAIVSSALGSVSARYAAANFAFAAPRMDLAPTPAFTVCSCCVLRL